MSLQRHPRRRAVYGRQHLRSGRCFALGGIKGSSEVSEGLTAAYQFEQKINSTNARKLLSAVMTSDADFVPDSDNTVLRVRLLGLGSDSCDRTLDALIDELNETQTIFPGTNLRLVYVIPNFSA